MQYDPFSGQLLKSAQPLTGASTSFHGRIRSDLQIIESMLSYRSATAPRGPSLRRPVADMPPVLTDLQVTEAPGMYKGLLYTLPGFGLLPHDPDRRAPLFPRPPAELMALSHWAMRNVCPVTGHIEGIQTMAPVVTITHKNPATGRGTATRAYRARIVVAAAMGLHPLTPVFAYYIQDPEVHGYGLTNIYTPTQAGVFQYHPLASTGGARRPRYVFHPLGSAEFYWPYGEPLDPFAPLSPEALL